MRKVIAATAATAIAALTVASSASAFEGGGRSPSTAPLIEWGQHYTAALDNRSEDANYSGRDTVALYKIPPLATHDQLVVNWHELPFAHSSGFPVCMLFVQSLSDYNWGTVFGTTTSGYCEGSSYRVSGSGTAQTSITVQNADANSYLEFFSEARQTESTRFETYPYDFSVESPRHALTLNFPSVKTVPANGTLGASVTGATGLPAPDGLVYTLTANWEHSGVWVGTGTSIGGQITFHLALPESAINERVRFIASRGPDGQFQAVESPATRAKVTSPVLPAPSSACKQATAHAQTLFRQYKRLHSHARYARGQIRRRLRNHARRVHRALKFARSEAAKACGRV
jgi:hypothetical protein